MVKDFLKRRRVDEDKAEKLFIDSIVDCEFMDEDEVCLQSHDDHFHKPELHLNQAFF